MLTEEPAISLYQNKVLIASWLPVRAAHHNKGLEKGWFDWNFRWAWNDEWRWVEGQRRARGMMNGGGWRDRGEPVE